MYLPLGKNSSECEGAFKTRKAMAGRNEFGSAEEFYAYRKNLLMNETNLETLIRKYDRLASGFDQVTPSSVLFLNHKI